MRSRDKHSHLRFILQRPEYPAAFVSDGQQIVSLWRVEAPDQAVAFDRSTNVGLHHLALAVADRVGLDALYERVASWPGMAIRPRRRCAVSHTAAEEPWR
jgi:hypothetical protein